MPHMTNSLKATALALPLAFGAMTAQAADVIDTLKQSDRFSQLAQAIEKAGIQDALKGEGPFTVFAPTNDAFKQLPQGAVDRLDQQQLKTLLQHHVVEGERIASDEIPERLEPMAGGRIDVSLAGDEILLYSAPPVGQQGQQQQQGQQGQQQVQQIQQQVQQAEQALQQQNTQQAQQALQQTQQPLQQALQQAQGQQQQLQQIQQSVDQAEQALQQQDVQGAQQALQQAQQPLQQLAQQQGGGQQQGQQATGAMTTGIERVTVAEGDIDADNGVIHAISGVLVPPDMEQALQQKQGQQ
jgi:uncharacterized surface protein with fasciclin (FAS1) repeats